MQLLTSHATTNFPAYIVSFFVVIAKMTT